MQEHRRPFRSTVARPMEGLNGSHNYVVLYLLPSNYALGISRSPAPVRDRSQWV